MSEKNAEATLPEPHVAYQSLFEGVYQRAYLHKLAGLRPHYMPQNEKQAASLFELAANLRTVQEHEAVKAAADADDPFAAANAHLSAVLPRLGLGNVQVASQQDRSIKEAAAAFAADPDLYNSVLSLKAAEAEGLAEQLAARQ